MMEWCMCCRKYIGEKEPIEEFTMTRGMCERCFEICKDEPNNLAKLNDDYKLIREFYDSIIDEISNKNYVKVKELLQTVEIKNLDIEDFLFGVLQPSLYLVGQKWEAGTINVADEHIFTEIIQTAMESIKIGYPELFKYLNSSNPQVVLTCSKNNFHSIGIKILELYLAMNNIRVTSILPGLEYKDLVEYIISTKPKIVGISIAICFHQKDVIDIENIMNSKIDKSLRPKVFVGGYPIRKGVKLRKDSTFESCSDLKVFLNSCKNILGE